MGLYSVLMLRRIDSDHRKRNRGRPKPNQAHRQVPQQAASVARSVSRHRQARRPICWKKFPGVNRREPPKRTSESQENAHGRSESTSDAGHAGPYPADRKCNGAHRPRRLPLAHLLHPGHNGCCGSAIHRPGYVAGHLRLPAALPGYCRLLCRDLQALPRHWIQLLLRRTGHALQRRGLQIRPYRQVRRRMGLAPLLLGLSRRDGGRHRCLRRLRGRLPVSHLHERLQPRTALHGALSRWSSHSSLRGSPPRALAPHRRSTSP